MKIKASIVIILISILLCCSIFGGAFALYSVGDSLEIPFSGKASEIVKFYLKITEGANEIATVELSDNEASSSEYKTTAYLKPAYKLSFYKNDKLLTADTDFQYDANSDVTSVKNPSHEFNYFVSYSVKNSSLATVNISLDRGYYLVGDINGWSIGENAIRFEPNPGNENEVMALNVPFSPNQSFKIRNYANYYGSVNDASPEVYTFSGSGDIVLKYGGNYDMYFNTTNNSVYFKLSDVTYRTFISYANSDWLLNDSAKIFAKGSDGKLYMVKTEWGYGKINLYVNIPNTVTSLTILRVDPEITYDSYTDGAEWNKATTTNLDSTSALF